jgi:F0F1-type ATP synthase membrane subunit c/vacuolar-type H+-ATPase subunit K
MGLVWSIPWALVIGAATGLSTFGFLGSLRVALNVGLRMGIAGALTGFGVGSLFSLGIMIAARNKSLSSLTLPRFALGGGLASVLFSTGMVVVALGNARPALTGVFLTISAALGATCAAASLALARHGSGGDEAGSTLGGASRSTATLPPDRPTAESFASGKASQRPVGSRKG